MVSLHVETTALHKAEYPVCRGCRREHPVFISWSSVANRAHDSVVHGDSRPGVTAAGPRVRIDSNPEDVCVGTSGREASPKATALGCCRIPSLRTRSHARCPAGIPEVSFTRMYIRCGAVEYLRPCKLYAQDRSDVGQAWLVLLPVLSI